MHVCRWHVRAWSYDAGCEGVPSTDRSQWAGLNGPVSMDRSQWAGPGLNNRSRPADRLYTHAAVSIPNPTEDNLRPSCRSLK